MKRIVSVFLPQWPIERLIRQARRRRDGQADLPASGVAFGLVETGQRGVRLSAVNRACEASGIRAGEALADARAMLPGLATAPADPAADRDQLRRLAFWLGRYGIARNAYGLGIETGRGQRVRGYGLWVDIAGVAHLYGGESCLLADLTARLEGFGLTARIGLADTFGAAHALAWHGPSGSIAAPGQTGPAIAGLPLAGLRLDAARVHLLHRLGFKRIGALAQVPRVALERRFSGRDEAVRVLLRLDQALGIVAEPRRPLIEVPVLGVQQPFAEPLITHEGLAAETQALVAALCDRLAAAGQGARSVRLVLYRSDGTAASARIDSSVPQRDRLHLAKLLGEKLASLDLGFGVDLLALEVIAADTLAASQAVLAEGAAVSAAPGAVARLVDRLANRLGGNRVTTIAAAASHWPERGTVRISALAAAPALPAAAGPVQICAALSRPALLLAVPEPVDVMAAIPEGAPVRFTWRRVSHRVVRASGPERIEPEWWREIGTAQRARSRDYYALEDEAGGRFWVFREGRYEGECDGPPPAWFVHGVFA